MTDGTEKAKLSSPCERRLALKLLVQKTKEAQDDLVSHLGRINVSNICLLWM